MSTGNAFADAITQALAPHQASYDATANRVHTWSASHWQAVEDLGLPKLLLPEEAGGSGAALTEAAAAIEALGAMGDPSPAADTALLAWCLHNADRPVPDGPLVLVAPDRTVIWPDQSSPIGASGGQIDHGTSDEVRPLLNSVPARRTGSIAAIADSSDRFFQAMTATRALQLVGAASAALDLTISYVRERSQFGRPLARFQAIQQHTAVAAAELAAAAQTARNAFASLERDNLFAVAAAKISAGRAATAVAKAAHQFHGAMGYTAEYPLHRLTRAIWQWREDYGNETWWSRRLGEQVCSVGADALWPTLVAD